MQSQGQLTLHTHACLGQGMSLPPPSTDFGQRKPEKSRLKQSNNTPSSPKPIVKEELRDSNQCLN